MESTGTAMDQSLRARIFLSSGQIDGSDEVKLVEEAKRRLESDEFGFSVSIGTGTNATESVASNVFRRLRQAEYLILVDFARGTVTGEPGQSAPFQRGSLYSEQELAVAVFRGLNYLVFQENGMLKRDGLLRHISSDPVFFDRATLVERICERVKTEIKSGRWDPDWRNELGLSRSGEGPDTGEWVRYGDEGKLHAKYFHVEVENRHRDQIATGVHAYLEAWTDSTTPKIRNIPPLVEIKFSGVRTRSVSIPPRQKREFDGVFVFQEMPGHAWVGLNTFLRDWTGLDLIYHFEGVGREIDLEFAVFCDQFEPARKRFRLRIGRDGNSTKLVDPESSKMPAFPLVPSDLRAWSAGSLPQGSGVTLSQVETGTLTGRVVVDPRP